MCGIVGRFAAEGSVDPGNVLPGLVNLLVHRGPDEGAYWSDDRFFLGHRRLSIIDLATGAQPMATPDGSLVVTFNGEIYNHRELRAELAARGHRFLTASDTEVLLHGYRAWGEDLPRRLRGMFAFAIADCVRSELFLARDRFGEKPLLYRERAGCVDFASELGPLAALPDAPRRLDEAALGSYLCLNYVPGEATLLEGVRRLSPASWRRYSRRGVEASTFWTPPRPAERMGLGLEEALGELRTRLDDAVRHALVADVPVGIFLSGGIDSSLVAESACRQGGLSRAYCLDFPEEGYSELRNATRVAKRLGLPLTAVPFQWNDPSEMLRVVEHADDPLADSSALAVWTVAREAARGNKVVLGGDGGDELFAGYLTYGATRLHASAIRRWPGAVRRALAAAAGFVPTSERKVARSYQLMRFLRAAALPSREAHFSWNGTWLPKDAVRFLRPDAARAAAAGALGQLAASHGLREPPALAELQRADLGDYLPNDILAKVDRTSMAHGLEVRAPMLDSALAELGLSLPSSLRSSLVGRPKPLLRELARRVYGAEIADARKQGFSIPIHAWIRGRFRDLAHDLLSPAAIGRIDALDAGEVSRALAAHMSQRRSLGFEIWGLMVLSAWHRARIESPPTLAPTRDLIRRQHPVPEERRGVVQA